MPDYIKAGLAALAVALLSGPVLIPILRRFKFGQFVRNDGPKTHLTKSGTPTMGGVMFFITMPVAMLFADKLNWQSFAALALMLALGLVGFADDYLKIKKRQSEGLTAPQKFAAQAVIGFFVIFLAPFVLHRDYRQYSKKSPIFPAFLLEKRVFASELSPNRNLFLRVANL